MSRGTDSNGGNVAGNTSAPGLRTWKSPVVWLVGLVVVAAIGVAVLALGGGGGETADAEATGIPGLRRAAPAAAELIQQSPPEGLIVLDVRTPEEFAEGHIDGATLLDFYSDEFADRVAELDADAPYLIYCRSGNRSGQTLALMDRLGFTDVVDVDGGILAWQQAGLPVTVSG